VVFRRIITPSHATSNEWRDEVCEAAAQQRDVVGHH
jgi:hypothetical protein